MAYYIRILPQGEADQFWEITEGEAIRLGVGNARGGPGSHYLTEPGETIWSALSRQTGWLHPNQLQHSPFHALDLHPRQYYSRISRPLSYTRQRYMRSPSTDIEQNLIAIGLGQLRTLMARLSDICQVIHPTTENIEVYGHEIRNLIILASTEAEAHWRGVLRANGVVGRLTTAEYVRLLRPMRLDEYSISFHDYPWLNPISPFDGWGANAPTQSLLWYDAYNHIKHDREHSFNRARLRFAFDAVVACVIMQIAQFTVSHGLGGESELRSKFRIVDAPHWQPNETYCDLGDEGQAWEAVQHPALTGL